MIEFVVSSLGMVSLKLERQRYFVACGRFLPFSLVSDSVSEGVASGRLYRTIGYPFVILPSLEPMLSIWVLYRQGGAALRRVVWEFIYKSEDGYWDYQALLGFGNSDRLEMLRI